MLNGHLHAGEELPVTLPASYNALAVVAKGRVQAGSTTASAGELVLFANDGERLTLPAREDAHMIILSGEPIEEPIVQDGPFVMNSIEEIEQAILNVNRGKLGSVPA